MTHPSDRPPLHVVPDGGLNDVPPHDATAEMAVIGALLNIDDQTAVETVFDTLHANDFYRPEHELIYDACADLFTNGVHLDPVVVGQHLSRTKTLDKAGGQTYLWKCKDACATTANTPHYTQIVRETATLRRIRDAGTALHQLAKTTTTDPDTVADLVDQASTKLLEVRPARTSTARSTWETVDLAEIIRSGDTGPRPDTITRRDGTALLYPGAIHSISGEPTSGKTWLAILGIAQEIEAGRPAAFFDFEDRANTLVGRLLNLGVDPDAIATHVRYIRPETALSKTELTLIDRHIDGCRLAVVDGVTEAMTMHGLSLMDNQDVAQWLALLPHYLANRGPAVLQIDHVVKDNDARGRYAIGGQHKLAGITGAAFKAVVAKPMARGSKGTVRIVIDKDRHGRLGPTGTTIADLTLDARDLDPTEEGGTAYAWLDEPSAIAATEDGLYRRTGYMERVSRFLETSPKTTQNGIEAGVGGTKKFVVEAVQVLIAEGHIITEPRPGGGTFHTIVRPFREDEK